MLYSGWYTSGGRDRGTVFNVAVPLDSKVVGRSGEGVDLSPDLGTWQRERVA